jgi:membrane peptidoglycan carboxypeptidase
VTSRADDFDVRYDEGGRGRHRGPGGPGGTGNSGGLAGSVDYDLGYDDNGWDTQGFRTPPGGYQTPASNYGPPAESYRPAGFDGGSYSDEMFRPQSPGTSQGTQSYQAEPFGAETIASSPVGTGTIAAPARRSRHGAPGAPRGPRGPRRPRGPGGPGGSGGKVKVKGSWWRHWTIRKAIGVFLSLIGLFIVLMVGTVVYIYNHTPVPTAAMEAALSSQTTVYAADGKTVIGRFGTTNRQVVNYGQIPKQLIYSVLAAEDRNFFNEGGVSPTGIMRAAYEDTLGGGSSLQGGSTITQQFVRQYYANIGTAQTASRKIKEIFVAMKIAREKSKQWILENYLNTIYLGEGANGIGAAAQTYFNIPVTKLGSITWSQAAMLAALIQQPSTYPLPQYRSNLEARWQYVRAGLLKMNWITQQQYDQMSFPKFGNYTPPNYGSAVWDPYVMDVVYNELHDIYGYSQSQLYNDGYKIVTTIDPAKEAALYQAVNNEEEQINSTSAPMQKYMHVGAVLEDPNTAAIEAMYPGPGYVGYKYNGTGKRITAKLCNEIDCQDNMAVYNREQVGSSFKPYILATAVAQGMNVQNSMLDGQDFVCIPPDSSLQPAMKSVFPDPTTYGHCQPGWYGMSNDSTAENGAFSVQDAMTNSVNTAYADLWHYVGGANVVHMASQFGVNTKSLADSGSGLDGMQNEAGVALGQASLTVGEQATMLAALDDGGVWHQIHIVKSISQSGNQYTLKLQPPHNVFNGNAVINQQMDSQVQYAMQQVAYKGTATNAGMSDGRQIISKTGTTNTAESAFFIGAIPQETLAVAMFTSEQDGKPNGQTLNGLGNQGQGFGGTFPALIWHSYAQNEFLQMQAQSFPTPVFTGQKWTLAPTSLLKPKHKKSATKKKNPGNNGNFPVAPSPTATCSAGQINVDCNTIPSTQPTYGTTGPGTGNTPGPTTAPGFGNGLDISTPGVTGAAAGAGAFGGGVLGLPAALLWVRRRQRRRRTAARGPRHG